jgi:hypothetical protein
MHFKPSKLLLSIDDKIDWKFNNVTNLILKIDNIWKF